MASEIHAALEMDPNERRARMQRMRQTVKEQNIYRWAGNLIAELCQVRLEAKEPARERAVNPPSVA
jgi:trehalose 6-phosphate synthase